MSKIPTEAQPLLLTVRQVASELQIGRNTAYELIAEGTIPTVKIRGSIRVPRAALERWVEMNTQQVG